jgi:hypothetical protein
LDDVRLPWRAPAAVPHAVRPLGRHHVVPLRRVPVALVAQVVLAGDPQVRARAPQEVLRALATLRGLRPVESEAQAEVGSAASLRGALDRVVVDRDRDASLGIVEESPFWRERS